MCEHTLWVSICKSNGEIKSEVTYKPHLILEELDSIAVPSPPLLVVVGNQSKRLALTELQIGNPTLYRKMCHGEIHLSCSKGGGLNEAPLLIGDCDIPYHSRFSTSRSNSSCHEVIVKKHEIGEQYTNLIKLGSDVIHRCLLPFADVVCLFAEDIGGISNVISHLNSWMDRGPISTSSFRPHLVLFVDKDDVEAIRIISQGIKNTTNLKNCFDDITTICMPEGWQRSVQSRCNSSDDWLPFKQSILEILEKSKEKRTQLHVNFSACHFMSFLQYSTYSLLKDPTPFDFIRASRSHNTMAPELHIYLKSFIMLFKSSTKIKRVAIPIVASSFILDHYTPDMHSMPNFQ